MYACRFFCGPNAKKSAALAKQQKKRPRGDSKAKGRRNGAAAKVLADDESGYGEEEDEVEEPVSIKGAAVLGRKRMPAERSSKKGKTSALVGKGKGKSAKVCPVCSALLAKVAGLY